MNFVCLDEVDSTNLYAKQHLNEFTDKTIIIAKRQTAGRGRLNRIWMDLGSGNLFVSIVLKPSDKFDKIFVNLTQYFSVVICKTLEFYGVKPEIKWPNDVLINGKKIAGILCETVMQGSELKGIVLGFGINITAGEGEVKKIADKAVTSLVLELKEACPNGKSFLNNLLNYFFIDYNKFLKAGFSSIKHDYLSYANFMDKELYVQVSDGVRSGRAVSIDNSGALHLKNNNTEFVLMIGDIL